MSDKSKTALAYFKKYGTYRRDRAPEEISESYVRLQHRSSQRVRVFNEWCRKAYNGGAVDTHRPPDVSGARAFLALVGRTQYKRYEIQEHDQGYMILYSRGVSTDRDYNGIGICEWVEVLRNHELPLLVNDPNVPDMAMKAIKRRLKGENPELPILQHLHDEYVDMDRKSKRTYTLRNAYKKMLEDYIGSKITFDEHKSPLMIVNIKGRTFYYREGVLLDTKVINL